MVALISLLGWLYIINCIDSFYNQDISEMLIGNLTLSYYLILPIIIFVFLETILFNNLKIKCHFLINNHFYNSIWGIGIISSITTNFFIIIYLLVN